MLKSFLYAVLKVYIYIRSDWYEPVTFFVHRKSHFLLYKKSPAGCALARIRIISKEYNSRSLCVVAQFRIRYNKVMISVYKKDKITYEMKYVTRRSWYVGFKI